MALKEVIRRVLQSEPLSSDELHTLASWLLSNKGQEDFHESLQTDVNDLLVDDTLDYDILLKQVQNRIDSNQRQSVKKRIRRYLWLGTSAAACIIIGILGIGRYLNTEVISETPDTYKAILTLADGKRLLLDNEQSGEIRQAGTVINIRDKQIDYTNDSIGKADKYNLLAVQRGGEYILTLSDGTVVWLNSDSKLKYPMQFAGKERRVILQGEAYFNVSADPDKPFIVETSGQEIKVLGTKFNISAYADESAVTTLLEGSVNLTSSTTLQQHRLIPGEQVCLDPLTHEFIVTRVNPEDVIAWTEGKFVFNDNTLEQVMKKLERWYNITVNYIDPKAKEIVFKGNLPRYADLKTLLTMIEKISPVRFLTHQNQIEITIK